MYSITHGKIADSPTMAAILGPGEVIGDAAGVDRSAEGADIGGADGNGLGVAGIEGSRGAMSGTPDTEGADGGGAGQMLKIEIEPAIGISLSSRKTGAVRYASAGPQSPALPGARNVWARDCTDLQDRDSNN